MAVMNYDDPSNRTPFDPTTPPGPLVDAGSMPTFYGGVTAEQPRSGGSGSSLPIMALVHFIAGLFGHGAKTQAPTGGNTTDTSYVGRDVARVASQSDGQPNRTGISAAQIQKLVQALGGIALAAKAGSGGNGSNPAADSLTGLVPSLTSNLSALLGSDVQRRQQSDPLYQAVLNGAMGGLPVWMRGGATGATGGSNGLTPPATPGAPVTPPVYPPVVGDRL